MTDLPAPLTPSNCNLQDFPRMMIDIPRLRGSAFDSTLDSEAWRAALNLWMSAWHHVPAAALEDNDADLAKAAGLGRDIRTWRKVKAVALRTWVKCSDGLLYQPTVAEIALEAWLEKLAQALSSGAGNAKRWGGKFDPAPIEEEIEATATMLSALNPKSKALTKLARRKSRTVSDGDADDIPPEIPTGPRIDPVGITKPSRRDRKGQGRDIVEEPPTPPDGGPSEVCLQAISAYPIEGTVDCPPAKIAAAWARAVPIAGGEARLLAAVKARPATKSKGTPRRFDRWLDDGSFVPLLPSAGRESSWNGPPELWTDVADRMGDDWCQTYLGQCTWRDGALHTASPTVAKWLTRDVGPLLEENGVRLILGAAA